LIELKEFKGWEYNDWESFPLTKKGHDDIIQQLEEIFKFKYNLKIEKFNPEEAWIAEKHRLKRPHYYVAHIPDTIITTGNKPEERIVIEYINSKSAFLRDLRGILALSRIMKAKGFVIVIRHSIFSPYALTGIMKDINVDIMSLKSMLNLLDHGDVDNLIT
jgi:hypothetical protein